MVAQSLLVAAAVLATTASARGKRGLAYNDGIDISGFPNSKVSWTYNWDSTTNANINYSEYIPMLWGTQSYHTNQWKDNVNYWLGHGTYRLLAFNEPDRPDQANMSPGTAVNAWRQYMEPFKREYVWLGAPAVSNGGYDWIRQFLDQCQGCHVDFVPVHWYNDHTQADDLINWMNKICDLANSHGIPHVWLTEFKAYGNEQQQIDFLNRVMPYFDSHECIERYSYFGINNGNKDMIYGNGPQLTNLGHTFGYA